jgi:hypothetical protein
MYITRNIPPATVQFGVKPRTILLTALGVLLAIAVTVVIVALTGANHATGATAVTASQAVSGQAQVHYLGPRQTRFRVNPTSIPGDGSRPAAHYTCLGVARDCRR